MDFYSVLSHNLRTIGLVLIKCYIVGPCLIGQLFYGVCKRTSKVSIHRLKIESQQWSKHARIITICLHFLPSSYYLLVCQLLALGQQFMLGSVVM
jgi:hypothetical protein